MKRILKMLVPWILFCSVLLVFFTNFKLNVVLSGSMEPVISTGDVAVTINDYGALHEQDVILYKLNTGIRVIHRIVRINEDGSFITKGDANEAEDFSSVNHEEILGKVVFTIPYLGKMMMEVRDNQSLQIMIASGLLLLFLLPDLLFKKDEQDGDNSKKLDYVEEKENEEI